MASSSPIEADASDHKHMLDALDTWSGMRDKISAYTSTLSHADLGDEARARFEAFQHKEACGTHRGVGTDDSVADEEGRSHLIQLWTEHVDLTRLVIMRAFDPDMNSGDRFLTYRAGYRFWKKLDELYDNQKRISWWFGHHFHDWAFAEGVKTLLNEHIDIAVKLVQSVLGKKLYKDDKDKKDKDGNPIQLIVTYGELKIDWFKNADKIVNRFIGKAGLEIEIMRKNLQIKLYRHLTLTEKEVILISKLNDPQEGLSPWKAKEAREKAQYAARDIFYGKDDEPFSATRKTAVQPQARDIGKTLFDLWHQWAKAGNNPARERDGNKQRP